MICLLIALVLVVIFFFANYFYKQTNAYRNQFVTINEYMQGVPKNIKIAAFGSTYAKYAFNSFKELNLNGFNFCLEAEALQCDLRLMKQYEKHLAPGCIVVINLAACVTCCKEEEEVVLYASNYYKVLKYNMLPNVLKFSIKRWFHYAMPLRVNNAKQVGRIIYDKDPIEDIVNRHSISVSNLMAKKNMEGVANGWIRMFNLKDLKSTAIPTEIEHRIVNNMETLKDIINYCKHRHWKPIIVIPPFSKELNQHFSDEFVNKVLLSAISKSYDLDKIPIYNYLKSPAFQENLNLFCDGGFRLNKYGSKVFMRKFLKDLTNDGVIADNSTLSIINK